MDMNITLFFYQRRKVDRGLPVDLDSVSREPILAPLLVGKASAVWSLRQLFGATDAVVPSSDIA